MDRFFQLNDETLNEFRQKNKSEEFDYNFWCDFFGNILQGYATARYDLNPDYVYRARINWDNTAKERIGHFKHINELGAPDDKCIKNMGRCNLINESVFYCSKEPITAFFEIRPDEGMEFSILEYKCNSNLLNLNAIGVEILSGLNSDLSEILKNHYHNYKAPLSYISKLRIVDSFLTKEFQTVIDEENKYSYHITNGITKFYLRENPKGNISTMDSFDSNGLVYPSVAIKKGGINFALKKNYYQSVLTPDLVKKLKVIKKRGEFDYDIQVQSNSEKITNDGEIIWQSNIGPVERITDSW